MSKFLSSVIDNINKLSSDEEVKQKMEKDIVNPLVSKGYDKLKPYLFMMLYMYILIVVLLFIIIILIIIPRKQLVKIKN